MFRKDFCLYFGHFRLSASRFLAHTVQLQIMWWYEECLLSWNRQACLLRQSSLVILHESKENLDRAISKRSTSIKPWPL